MRLIFTTLLLTIMAGSCNTTELKMSPIEKQYEKYPNMAGHLACLRANAKSDTRSGFNVRDCDPYIKLHEIDFKYLKCVEARIEKITCYRTYYISKLIE